MSHTLTVASIQMVSTQDCQENLDKAKKLIQQAAEQGAEFVLLPEYFCLIHSDPKAKFTIAEPFGEGPIQTMLSETAKKYNIWLAGGSMPLDVGVEDKVTNTLLLYAPDGTLHTRYDKVHLFSIETPKMKHNEGDTMVRGDKIVVAQLPFARVGFAICYDIRFQAFFEAMGEVDLILMPAAFTYLTGKAHWELLLKARAIDNQCFVLASAQGGKHESGRQTWGHSMIVDPWANIVDSLPEGEGIVMATIDLEKVKEYRQSLPVVRDRQLLKQII